MGLAFKPDIDDLRESPALYITQRLATAHDDIAAVEPNIPLNTDVAKNLKIDNPSFKLMDIFDAIEEADLLVFLVAHKQFKHLDVSDLEYLDFCGVTNKKHRFN